MPTGTNLTYVSAAGSGHYPIPTTPNPLSARAPRKPRVTGLDWSKHTAPEPERPAPKRPGGQRKRICRGCDTKTTDLVKDLCATCRDAAEAKFQVPEPIPVLAEDVVHPAPELTAAERDIIDRIEHAPDALLEDEIDDATSEQVEKREAPGVLDYTAQVLADTAHHPQPAVQALRSSILSALAALDLLVHSETPVAASASQVYSNPPASSDLPDAATGPAWVVHRRSTVSQTATLTQLRDQHRHRMAALGVTAKHIRTWAAANHIDVPRTGMLPLRVLDAYELAHPTNPEETHQ